MLHFTCPTTFSPFLFLTEYSVLPFYFAVRFGRLADKAEVK